MKNDGRTEILLVEDNQDHAELTMRALRKGHLANHIIWVKDGLEAMDVLHARNAYADRQSHPLPGLVLLDINLPKLSGLEVLAAMKSDSVLRVVPVIMLTTSGRDEEVKRSFELGANSFVTKPVQFSEFSEKIRQIEMYWLLVNRLPPAAAA